MFTLPQKRHWLSLRKYAASYYSGKVATAQPYIKHLMREKPQALYLVKSDEPLVLGPFSGEDDCYELGFFGVLSHELNKLGISMVLDSNNYWSAVTITGDVIHCAERIESVIERVGLIYNLVTFTTVTDIMVYVSIVAILIEGVIHYHIHDDKGNLIAVTLDISFR